MRSQQCKKDAHIVAVTGATFQGSGMNHYLLNVALSWKKLGYRVTIICQDRNAEKWPFVDSYIKGQFDKSVPKLKDGQLRVVIPDIGSLIPIYATYQYCQFPGISAKAVQQMSDQEIQNNIKFTSVCLKSVCQHDRPFKVIANYMLLSGIICKKTLKQFQIPFDIIVPGPALQYSVKPYPHLWKWVLPAFKKASIIFQHTQFVRTQFLKCFKNQIQQYKLNKKAIKIQPGIDPSKFKIPKTNEDFYENYKKITHLNDEKKQPDMKIKNKQSAETVEVQQIVKQQVYVDTIKDNTLDNKLFKQQFKYSQNDEIIIYSGAFMSIKGIGQFLTIAPKLIQQRPNLKVIFCGSGPHKKYITALLQAFEKGDLQKAKQIGRAQDFITEIDIQKYFFTIDSKIRQNILICDMASDKQLLPNLLPLCTLYMCPSRKLENCSMNIIEAMCYGVTPICNDHSWYNEVLDIIQKQYPDLAQITRVERQQFYQKLFQTILKTLDFIKNNKLTKINYRLKIRQIAVDYFGWEHIAKVLASQRIYQQESQQKQNNQISINQKI